MVHPGEPFVWQRALSYPRLGEDALALPSPTLRVRITDGAN
jgi:hypothetical protein